jgi:hypothetical protein
MKRSHIGHAGKGKLSAMATDRRHDRHGSAARRRAIVPASPTCHAAKP